MTPKDRSWEPMGDMLEALVIELRERLTGLGADDFRLVYTAITIAANNARIIGVQEAVAQAIQQGHDLRINMVEGEQAPTTLADAPGEDASGP